MFDRNRHCTFSLVLYLVVNDVGGKCTMEQDGVNENKSVDDTPCFVKEKHVEYLFSVSVPQKTVEWFLTEHLRLGGTYWCLGALSLLHSNKTEQWLCEAKRWTVFSSLNLPWKNLNEFRAQTVAFIRECKTPNAGYGYSVNHDAHITSTLVPVV